MSEAIKEFKIYALIVIETWLKDNKKDDQLTKSSELNTNGYQIQTINRINKRGVGAALITKDEAQITSLDTNNYTSFEHKTWNIQFKSKLTYTVTSIYHPHPTTKQMTTHQHSRTNSPTFYHYCPHNQRT